MGIATGGTGGPDAATGAGVAPEPGGHEQHERAVRSQVVVLPRQMLSLPAHVAAATPYAFLPPIPLAVPFSYDPANGGLLLGIVVHGQPRGAYSLDVTWDCNSPEVLVGPASCLLSTGHPLRVESATTQVIWGRPSVARVLDAPSSAIVVLALGIVTSQARKVQVRGWKPVGRVWSAGVTVQFGTCELGLGAVAQIWWQ